MELENKIEKIKMLITKEFIFLEDLGYQSSFEIKSDSTFIESALARYIDVNKKRNINITYTKGEVYGEIKYTFGLSILRIPYTDVNDYFSLDMYLDSLNSNFPSNIDNHFDEEEAKLILRNIAAVTKANLLDVILGSVWLSNYWPRW